MMKRVLRILEYVGPEDWVDNTLARSLSGYEMFGSDRGITAITLTTGTAEEAEKIINEDLFMVIKNDPSKWRPWFPPVKKDRK